MKKLVLAGIALALVAFGVWAADELTVAQGWTYSKSGRSRVLSTSGVKFTVTGDGVMDNVVTIPTTAAGTVLDLGGVTTPGFAWFHNIATSNYVEIGTQDANTNFVPFVRLYTNGAMTCWLSITNVYARANLGSVKLEYMILDR